VCIKYILIKFVCRSKPNTWDGVLVFAAKEILPVIRRVMETDSSELRSMLQNEEVLRKTFVTMKVKYTLPRCSNQN
jgi:hypothetical protein